MVALRPLMEGALELLYPSGIYCACCKDAIDPDMPYGLCGKCIREIHWLPEDLRPAEPGQSEAADEYGTGHLFDRAISCAIYESRTREMLRRFKYGGRPGLRIGLGHLMLERARRGGLQDSVDLVVPVPMHRSKEKIRGYNQAALLAFQVAQGLSLPCMTDGLLRVRGTSAMSVLSASERRLHLEGAFQVAPKWSQSNELAGKRILLVDDILTTGTTADQCCSVLQAAGAASVSLLVFASGERI